MILTGEDVITVERTFDAALIKRVITEPENYAMSTDDGSPSPDLFEPPLNDGIIWISVQRNGRLGGLLVFVPQNFACYDVHVAFLLHCRGRRAARAFKLAFQWIWENTPCRRICATIPEFNRAAVVLARIVGMIQYGCNEKSFLKCGVLYDQKLLGVSKCH